MPVVETVKALATKLDEGQHRLAKLDKYYDGRQGLQYGTEKFRAAFDGKLSGLNANFCRVVVDAVAERLAVTGFRMAGADEADETAWSIWQANDMDEASQLAHAEALISGRAYVLVWANPDGSPRITVESARQVVCQHDPATRRRTAALKAWRAEGYGMATLYLPTEIHRFRSTTKVADGVPVTSWEPRGEVIPNPLGAVPVVPVVNRGRLLDLEHGASELDAVAPVQDMLNRTLADTVVAMEFHSLPRRWATGMEVETDPETGQPLAPFDEGVGRLWIAEEPTTKFGQFPEADLSGLHATAEMAVQLIGSLSATPPHYLLQAKGGPASAESIKSSEASLVAKVKRRQLSFGASWEETMRLALAVEGGSVPAGAASMETVWADPETRSLGQAADAALKRREVGVPVQQLWADLGYSPVERERFRTMQREAAADAAAIDVASLFGEPR